MEMLLSCSNYTKGRDSDTETAILLNHLQATVAAAAATTPPCRLYIGVTCAGHATAAAFTSAAPPRRPTAQPPHRRPTALLPHRGDVPLRRRRLLHYRLPQP